MSRHLWLQDQSTKICIRREVSPLRGYQPWLYKSWLFVSGTAATASATNTEPITVRPSFVGCWSSRWSAEIGNEFRNKVFASEQLELCNPQQSGVTWISKVEMMSLGAMLSILGPLSGPRNMIYTITSTNPKKDGHANSSWQTNGLVQKISDS